MESANTYPQICFEVGLSCETCTGGTARQLAAVCKGLRGRAVGQLFVQLYPNPACSPMHSHFAACYREGASDEEMAPAAVSTEAAEQRREVTFARPRAMRAVA